MIVPNNDDLLPPDSAPQIMEDADILEAQEKAAFMEAIREGERDIAAGRVKPIDEAFAEIRARLGFEA